MKSTRNLRASKGFALVVALLLMSVITIVAVGLLGLSSISLRSSTQSLAQTEARSNARLALMIAIGELQKQLGPDQRISANGAITDESAVRNPHWTGVWDSWIAGNPDLASVNDDYPSAASQHSTIGPIPEDQMHPNYAEKDSHFRAWLLSLDPGEAGDVDLAGNLELAGSSMPNGGDTAVRLVAEGTLGTTANPADFVNARLLSVDSTRGDNSLRGRYGWWIGDESQKARLMPDSHTGNVDPTPATRLARHQAPGSMGTSTIPGLENITTDRQLDSLPSLQTIGLLDGATDQASRNFHHITPFTYKVLADVREGGLKRDLSTLLDRPIDLGENGDEFMLYRFGQERVPIQDLAAYYQLYKPSFDDAAGNAGVRHASAMIANGMQVESPDYGGAGDRGKLYRQFTALYRSPVPVKFQFILGLQSILRPTNQINATYPDTNELAMTITVAISLWNPTNLPLVMDNRESLRLFQRMRWWHLPLSIEWSKPGTGWSQVSPMKNVFAGGGDFAFELDVSRNVPLRFEPGEVKVLSVPFRPATNISFDRFDGDNNEAKRLFEGWDPEGLNRLSRSANTRNQAPHLREWRLLFSQGDQIQVTVRPDNNIREPILIQLGQDSYHDVGILLERSHYNYTLSSRGGTDRDFNERFMLLGFENNQEIRRNLPVTTLTPADPADYPVDWPFISFSIMAGSETHENSNGGFSVGGRKFASRPFLHSSALRQGRIDADDDRGLYNSGWNWWVEPINSILEAPVEVVNDGRNGFYGGGYSIGSGTTHVVQQEIPVVPPMSIAALSHAHLGGYSLADAIPPQPWSPTLEPSALATGRGGMFPHTIQAIGNSYAHPYLDSDLAFDPAFQRIFTADDGAASVVFADHSYLANKALWDEFYFSTITPQPAAVRTFGGIDRTAKEVAEAFFLNNESLPNQRFVSHATSMDQAALDTLFDDEADDFLNGLADKIASHLMVEGPFNINSTSIDAWRALLSSLKGKPVAYLDKNNALAGVTNPDEAATTGVPVSSFTMPNAAPSPASELTSDPAQWLGWRELNDTEIDELAAAIIRQVKLRGPFLSLSEFVNRRLDSAPALSTKGALQAALDDPAVSINANFRNPERVFSDFEKSMTSALLVFPEALDGPVAYGSAAYVDQADLLRNFAAQLTPRGDTFVIRAYGDAMDASGNITARAWCEAIVQRVPEYFDADEPSYRKQADLTSPGNRTFGRKMRIVSFRWLHRDEV